MSIPVDALIRGEDGPVHGGEALAEEGGGEGDDEVVGLEPGDELFAAFWAFCGVADFAEADKGVHFMDVTADVLGHGAEGLDVVICGEGEEVFFSVGEPPEEGVEVGPLGAGAVGGGGAGEV